jgi:hypothetical protein
MSDKRKDVRWMLDDTTPSRRFIWCFDLQSFPAWLAKVVSICFGSFSEEMRRSRMDGRLFVQQNRKGLTELRHARSLLLWETDYGCL